MRKLIILIIYTSFVLSSPSYAEDFKLESHYNNYIFPASYYQVKNEDEIMEAKFQISVKKQLYELKEWELYFAYTQIAWFDVYNEQESRPFRETNYNPQFFIRTPKFGPFQLDGGYWHESNGGRPDITRSWERWYLEGSWMDEMFDVRVKLWNSFWPEDPEMAETAGSYEVEMTLKYSDIYLTVVETKAYEEVIVSHPMFFFDSLYSVYSYRTGKYDNQLDWDKEIERFGIGVMLTRR